MKFLNYHPRGIGLSVVVVELRYQSEPSSKPRTHQKICGGLVGGCGVQTCSICQPSRMKNIISYLNLMVTRPLCCLGELPLKFLMMQVMKIFLANIKLKTRVEKNVSLHENLTS